MELEQIVFWVLATGAVAFALLMVTGKSAIVSALMLVLTFMCLAGLYLTLHAQFLAVVQVTVYAGAIMVLVLFVIMLLNLKNEEKIFPKGWKTFVGLAAALGVLAQVLAVIYASSDKMPQAMAPNSIVLGTTEGIGRTLYTSYSFPFEMASIILISAAVGAIILAKKRLV
ncbi:MAG: NADH-quinone oxidoreductase subunit J [Candidatus Kapaibacterium sp.]|jgi:NADH-quinone oxidoreductase subunit J